MSLFTVDQERCNKDHICIAECPFRLLIPGAEGYPVLRPAAERLCIHCGHCLAACPTAALSFPGMSPDDCLPLDSEQQPTPEMVEQLLKSRRSVRTYTDQAVPPEMMAKIIDTTRWAPSARNQQPCKWQIISSPAKIRQLSEQTVDWLAESRNYPGIVAGWNRGEDMILRGAPHLALVYARQDSLNPEIDCTIALTYFELAAVSHGLGGCWAGILMSAAQVYEPLIATLQLPAGHRLYGALMFGYPLSSYARIPPRRPSRVQWL